MTTMNTNQQCPITLLICALGGEGGGVLTEWLVDIARHAGDRRRLRRIAALARGVDDPVGEHAAAFAAEGADEQGEGAVMFHAFAPHAGCSARTTAPRSPCSSRSCHFGFCTTSAR